MSITHQSVCGIAAAVVSTVAGALYVRDIVRGRTKPSRVSWWVLAYVNLALAASYYASGARETIWLPADYALSFLVVAILSLKWGDDTRSWVDVPCAFGAAAGLVLWWATRSGPAGLAVFIAVELLGFVPTVVKGYRAPETEHFGAWLVAVLASFLNVLAVADWTPAVWIYPVYVFVGNAAFSLMLALRGRARTRVLACG